MFDFTTRRLSKSVLAVSWVLILAACGGGGGGNSSSEPTVPTSGRYVSSQFAVSDVVVHTVDYSTRGNRGGLQYTSSDSRVAELADPSLTLSLDVLVPPGASSAAPKPLVIWVHGGGFYEGGKSDVFDAAMSYARAGYVAAALNYRLTTGAGVIGSAIRAQAVKDATEDTLNAVRYLKQHAATYGIDVSRIAMIGASAGGALVLFNAVDPDGVPAWGLTSDEPGQSSKVAAAVSTGAVLGDKTYAQATFSFDASDTPVLLFHAKETDSETGFTWADYALPNQKLINDSGNTCTVVAQPNLTHTVDLSLGGGYWTSDLLPFLWARLRLASL